MHLNDKILKLINTPYPLTRRKWLVIWGSSLSTIILVFILTHVSVTSTNLLYGILTRVGIGILIFTILVFFEILLPRLLPDTFRQEKWTFGKEINMITTIVVTCGLACCAYSLMFIQCSDDNSIEKHFLRALYYTATISFLIVVPISAIKYLLFQRNIVKLNVFTEDENSPLSEEMPLQKKQHHPAIIQIKDENDNTKLEIGLSELLFIESEGNNICVHYRKSEKTKAQIFRSTLKKILESNPDAYSLKRCHRAFLVNTDKIESIAGNSRSLRLILSDCKKEVPVSRNYVHQIRELAGIEESPDEGQ